MAKPKTKKKILIVEDESIAGLVKFKFEQKGFDAYVARDGKEALELMEKVKPDIALVDILMPDMDGYEFIEKIRKDERFKKLVVIVFSNIVERPDVQKLKDLRVKDYIQKVGMPIDALVQRVIDCCGN